MINYWEQINLSCQWKVFPKPEILKRSTTSGLLTGTRILWGMSIGILKYGFIMLVRYQGLMGQKTKPQEVLREPQIILQKVHLVLPNMDGVDILRAFPDRKGHSG